VGGPVPVSVDTYRRRRRRDLDRLADRPQRAFLPRHRVDLLASRPLIARVGVRSSD